MTTAKNVQESGSVLGEAYEKVSDTVASAYATARGKAAEASDGAIDGIAANPIVALLGGLVLGAIAGAVIPVIAREREMLSPLGGRIADGAKAAFDAAKTAGGEALSEGGLTQDNLREQAGTLFGQILKAAGAAGTAAVGAARDR